MSTLLTDNIGDGLATRTVPISSVTLGTVKSWTNYDQTVPNVVSSYNTSSVTDVATGDFIVIFTNNMNDTLYAWGGGGGTASTTTSVVHLTREDGVAKLTSECNFVERFGSGSTTGTSDETELNPMVYGDLA